MKTPLATLPVDRPGHRLRAVPEQAENEKKELLLHKFAESADEVQRVCWFFVGPSKIQMRNDYAKWLVSISCLDSGGRKPNWSRMMYSLNDCFLIWAQAVWMRGCHHDDDNW